MKGLFLKTIGQWILSDWFAYRFPVSVKGICFIDGKVVLLKNERGEWDLPGGKLGRNEEVEAALQREIHEELGIEIQVGPLLKAFRTKINQQVNVVLIVYACTTNARIEDLQISAESFALGVFNPAEVKELVLAQEHWQALIDLVVQQQETELNL
ncbi:MAG: NUDIX hydrolase [Bacteroidota bacterium]